MKEVLLVSSALKFIGPKILITENVDSENKEGLVDRLHRLGDILDHRGCSKNPIHSARQKKEFLIKTPAMGNNLEVGFSGDMIDRAPKSIHCTVDRGSNADEDGYA